MLWQRLKLWSYKDTVPHGTYSVDDIADLLVGEYERSPPDNPWHYVTITKAGSGRVHWKNRAPCEWDLAIDAESGELKPLAGCPYPGPHYVGMSPEIEGEGAAAELVRNDDGSVSVTVTHILFSGERYVRV